MCSNLQTRSMSHHGRLYLRRGRVPEEVGWFPVVIHHPVVKANALAQRLRKTEIEA